MKHIKPIKGVWPVLLICLLLSAVLFGVCGVLRLVVLQTDTYMRAGRDPVGTPGRCIRQYGKIWNCSAGNMQCLGKMFLVGSPTRR